ncbi:endonuclease III, partial [Rhodopseudomonas sp. BR0C11]|nr:endonuclease III [Rhodopseudomonas sp. BR0C11]
MPKTTRRPAKPAAKPPATPPAKRVLAAKAKSAPVKPARRRGKSPGRWSAAEVHEAFSRFAKANPEPKGELEHLNPFTLLVAVVLSAQATDAGVNKATRPLFAVADTPQKML